MIILLAIDLVLMAITAYFVVESVKEQEPRAPKVGLWLLGVLAVLALAILFVPTLRFWIALGMGLMAVLGAILLIPGKGNPGARAGADGQVVGQVERFDERDHVFARNRCLPEGSEVYHRYYSKYPDREAPDAQRRARGGNVGRPGNIDSGYQPNVAMMGAAFGIPPLFGPRAYPEPVKTKADLSPGRATEIVKGWAYHLGADLVGVCRTAPRWTYSHRGEIFYENWEDSGQALPDPLPFALVFAVEMDHANIAAAPHTPTVVESATSYSKGACISTILADTISGMGYRAVAEHSRNYNSLSVPMAVNAGLGEMGRLGYLIAPKYGPRIRIFVVTTDLELVPDQPLDLGVAAFCKRCKKCAESCPSKSLPLGEKVVIRGVRKWQMDAESCYAYWAKAGTDCSVCMAVCPFARPDTLLHRLTRRLIAHSDIARSLLPPIDNFIYGRHWHPRKAPDWIDYPKPADK